LDYPLGQPYRTEEDKWCAFLLQLDKWELTDDLTKLDDPELFKKVNRSIGTTVQPTYYRERLHEAATGTEDTKQEVLTKDLNCWQTGKVTKWIVTADKVRALQVNRRVTDCLYDEGWQTFVGMDFGGANDFMAISTLSVNYADGLEMKDRFFADTIAWITEAALRDSPNKALYDIWVEQGWLKVCEGEVFDASLAVNELMQLTQHGINLIMFGYDPAQSKDPINNIKAWLQSLGQNAETIKSMLVPVAQNFMTMNQVLSRLEYMTLATEPWLRYSPSPLWPWMAGNASVTTSRDDTLRKIVKTSEHTKVDCLHALLDALFCFDLSEGRIEN
jgi:phage terminase large subunit-like protein